MKIGYPCINTAVKCTANNTFRLKNYAEQNLIDKVRQNLECLQKILEFNVKHKILFFRIGSGLIPFASHPICKFKWQKHFSKEFKQIGNYIQQNNIRISMHPDQFTLINALDKEIVKRSVKELSYHCGVLDAMGLDKTAKVQIHVGGVYGDKQKSMQRFVTNYKKLPAKIKKRLVIENDHVSYSLKDCLVVSRQTGVPIVFDSFHHECLNNGESLQQAVITASQTWQKSDGDLMVDYSSQKKDGRRGSHIEHINLKHFKNFIQQTRGVKLDVMLEIKDKQKSALKVVGVDR